MATKYSKAAQTGSQGVALVQQIITKVRCIYRPFDVADVGIDGILEFLNDKQEPSGDLVLAQIKAGPSYINKGRFYVHGDRDHFETWSRYAIPVVGVVCNPATSEARWVDISEYLRENPERIAKGPFRVEAPASQRFSAADFPKFAKRFRRSPLNTTRTAQTPNLLIRAWKPGDADPTRVLLSGIAPDYPKFYDWLGRNFTKGEVSKKVVVIGKAIAAFSMWQYKDERNVKLQTFVVGPQFRGTAIGQHLLYHEILTWANDPKVERVFVTVASSKSELIGYFRTFGFRVEGIAANRYPRASDAAELVMAKHFVREVVRTPGDLERVSKGLVRRVWGIDSLGTSCFGVTSNDLAVPAFFSKVKINVDLSEATIAPRLKLATNKGRNLLVHDDESLMREFLPLRIHLRRKRFVIIPIYRQWVDAMLSTSGPGTPLKLRIANVYYCYPKLGDLRTGDLVLFYETKKGGGLGAAIGAAVVQEVVVDTPAKLHAKFSDLGIYQLDDIRRHVHNATGRAMAIKFALFEYFLKSVPLAKIQRILGNHATMQGLTPISREGFESIRNKGLSVNP